MKKQFDIKKLVLLNLPYLLMGLFATNFGEAWRLAQGANASEKFLSLFAVLPGALQSFWPSLHPLDLLVGLCCGAGLRLAVYLKSKNAKKYRHGMEYGSARWGTSEDTARRVTLRNSGKNMRKKFCSTRLLRMPLMRWASRSCPRSKSCRRSTRNCWKKRKRPMPSTGVPVKKCGSF